MISGILESSDFHSLFVFYGDTFPSDEIFGSPVWKQGKHDLFSLIVCVCTCIWGVCVCVCVCVCERDKEESVERQSHLHLLPPLSTLFSHIQQFFLWLGSNHHGFKTTYNIKVHLAIFKRRSTLGKHIGLHSLPWLPVWVYANYLTTLVLHLKTVFKRPPRMIIKCKIIHKVFLTHYCYCNSIPLHRNNKQIVY